MKNINTKNETVESNNDRIKDLTNTYGDRVSESIQPKFPIKENIESPESTEKIKSAFSFYKNDVLPLILDNLNVTQKREGYHGLLTHTENVVFRGICYAVSLGEDPIPVILACACHDLAKAHDGYDEEHGKNAIPVTQEIINNENFNLSKEEKKQIIDAVFNHTTGKQATNYISACLWDADRTRLSWQRGYREDFFNTEQGKQTASNKMSFLKFQKKFGIKNNFFIY